MISKKNRLYEREVKKVLQKWKPFFSSSLVFNVLPNTLASSRFAIVISWKSVPNNVIRNKYRRAYYEVCRKYVDKFCFDIACVVKVKTKLGREDTDVTIFEKELTSIFQKKLWKNT